MGKLRTVQARIKWWLRTRYWQASVAGLLLALAFPQPGVAGLAWLAPGLILLTALGSPGPQAFGLGYVAGLTYALYAFHWLLFIPVKFLPILGWLALSAYLALYPACWVWGCWKMFPFKATEAAHDFWLAADQVLEATAVRRSLWVLASATLWVALEMVRSWLLTGFPWNLLGVSQYQMLPLVQLASVTGVYGLSFVVVWTSLALALTVLKLVRRPGQHPLWIGELALPLAVVGVIWLWGAAQVEREIEKQPLARLKIALVQPSIPQSLIWDSATNSYRFAKLLQLTERALSNKPDLLLWPEAAVPEMLRYDEPTYDALTNIAIQHRVWMIVGSDDREPSREPGKQVEFHNAAFLISPEGRLLDRYCKRQLVIFGEYVPFSRWLPFLTKLLPGGEGFTPGREAEPFELQIEPKDRATNAPAPGTKPSPRALAVRAALLICFEDVFPCLTRQSMKPDTDFLVNLTNDGWFKESAAQLQHAANAVFRAVESRRPLIRCTNNGLTCWVDAAGRMGPMEETYTDNQTGIYAEGYKIAFLPLSLEARGPLTFYQRRGDWFGWLCVILAGLLMGKICYWLFQKATHDTRPNNK